MIYPFQSYKVSPAYKKSFLEELPQVSSALPEFFRATTVASQSVQQRDIFGNPRGIRQDAGVDDSLKLLLLACFNDGLLSEQAKPAQVLDLVRQLSLLWYSFDNKIDSCIFLGYYFYEMQSTALHLVDELKKQIGFLASVSGQAHRHLQDGVDTLMLSYSPHWYRAQAGIGDKKSDIFIADGDFTKTDLPRPGYQIHFKKSKLYDLRAPFFVSTQQVETPLVQQDKIVSSCPSCGQKCRGKLFSFIEIKCPKCSTVWQQKT